MKYYGEIGARKTLSDARWRSGLGHQGWLCHRTFEPYCTLSHRKNSLQPHLGAKTLKGHNSIKPHPILMRLVLQSSQDHTPQLYSQAHLSFATPRCDIFEMGWRSSPKAGRLWLLLRQELHISYLIFSIKRMCINPKNHVLVADSWKKSYRGEGLSTVTAGRW